MLFTGSEARHMLTVLRTQENQVIRLFDGDGRDGLFVVKDASNRKAVLEAQQLDQHPRVNSGLTVAVGWGKSKRRKYLFEKAVELRADGIAFWTAKRSQGRMPEHPKESWREKILQAAKQCGNPYLPQLTTLDGGLSGLMAFAETFDTCFLAWESKDVATVLAPDSLGVGKSLIVIGPEGGLEDEEAARLIDFGFLPVTLGDSILRWETAAMYCLSLGWYARQVSDET